MPGERDAADAWLLALPRPTQRERMPARTLLLVVGVAAVLVAAIGVRVYAGLGPHLARTGGVSVGIPLARGEEGHTFVGLAGEGGTVTLLSARPVGADPTMRADLRVVRLNGASPIGSSSGPLGAPYQLSAVHGATAHPPANPADRLWLDLRVVATTPGPHLLRGVDVTYRSGFLRTRTVRVDYKVCVSVAPQWRGAINDCA